jgi:hypothetical protein
MYSIRPSAIEIDEVSVVCLQNCDRQSRPLSVARKGSRGPFEELHAELAFQRADFLTHRRDQ